LLLLPTLLVVPSAHLLIEVLRQPFESTQYTSIAFTTRLLESGVDASVGSVGDAYDNALAETTVGLYKTEWINRRGPWRNLDHVEIATLEWVDWYNHRRPHQAIDDFTPVAVEDLHYAHTTPSPRSGTQQPECPDNPGRFTQGVPYFQSSASDWCCSERGADRYFENLRRRPRLVSGVV
jgi:putative transposase